MTDIQLHLKEILAELPPQTRLVAVSKFHPAEAIREAYDMGQRIFGESKVQELTGKYESLPKDIEWHFIGHLQTNKVKYIAPFVSMIHAVDSFKLLCEIDKQAAKVNRVIPCLLEMHVAQEESKFGFTFEECRALLAEGEWKNLSHVSIAGIMGMASYTDDLHQIQQEFQSLSDFFKELKNSYFSGNSQFCELSMGMSHDYPEAVKRGSTLVRVGSKIFGDRIY
ncbi:YggS family pyridoxal phosphate-dependent enzyme [Phocaeicola faecicola]|jgi:pyridoxal phosphate enzyme (YggS family)|uniref:YggS family pyridoxal phosphate-dependent enzyme n=1 Tax=Phocaeicola faecicola TaxID=2739389 RepID=UPI0015E6E7F8|nr:YggS family pyridoxal phosphate-dependent enzyme [Phocaeicola faecicola]MCI5744336.1 YggS family pyridoxal phosphate-dependent enzyme [Bacteroides sp.]MDD6908494.1 YggS family pyridoxal phosphate-dependent enzyme [Bacteroidaceae bacterium]MDY4872774.1 YggS family pyridoxal phosphate-dependent enzyme [Phocaeicola faecicola]